MSVCRQPSTPRATREAVDQPTAENPKEKEGEGFFRAIKKKKKKSQTVGSFRDALRVVTVHESRVTRRVRVTFCCRSIRRQLSNGLRFGHLVFFLSPPMPLRRLSKVGRRVGIMVYGSVSRRSPEGKCCVRGVLLLLSKGLFIRDFSHNVIYNRNSNIDHKSVNEAHFFKELFAIEPMYSSFEQTGKLFATREVTSVMSTACNYLGSAQDPFILQTS